jgi:ribose 5-phosphate isomerase A
MSQPDQHVAAKIDAAQRSLAFVESGMVIGLGSGTTAAHVVRLLGERVAAGLVVRGVSSSSETRRLAEAAGVPLATFAEVDGLDLTIDGADEIDAAGRMIKGRGGALLYEKILAAHSRQLVIVVDARKQVPVLGAAPVPVEVIPMAGPLVRRDLERLGARVELRGGGSPFVTDEGNHILDCHFGAIPDPDALAARLDGLVGAVEHGLFVGFTPKLIVGR